MAENDLDIVQHPTLGELKFPKDMPIAERNESIQRTLLTRPDVQAPPAVAKPAEYGELNPAVPSRQQILDRDSRRLAAAGQLMLGGGGLETVGQEAVGAIPALKAFAERPAIKPYVQSAGILAKAAGKTIEDLPVIGSVVKGAKTLGALGDVWREKPTYPGAPLPEHPGVFPGAPKPAMPLPEQLNPAAVSPARTMPGQVAPETIRPRAITTAEPLPPRTGLALPSAPVGAELKEVPITKAIPSSQTGEALGQLPKPISTATASPRAMAKVIDTGLKQGLGATEPAIEVPAGHIPVKSSALRSYRYDPGSQELHITTNTGDGAIYGEVTPEQAKAFEDAKSKGQAWKAIKDNNVPVAKVVDGKRIPIKPPIEFRSASPNDLTPLLKKSVDLVKKSKAIPAD